MPFAPALLLAAPGFGEPAAEVGEAGCWAWLMARAWSCDPVASSELTAAFRRSDRLNIAN